MLQRGTGVRHPKRTFKGVFSLRQTTCWAPLTSGDTHGEAILVGVEVVGVASLQGVVEGLALRLVCVVRPARLVLVAGAGVLRLVTVTCQERWSEASLFRHLRNLRVCFQK